MPDSRVLFVLAAAALSASAGAVELSVSGACPGPMTFTVTDATARANVALLSGAEGVGLVPAGACRGTPLELRDGLTLRGVVRADGGGTAGLAATVPESACGSAVQAIDLVSCDTTAVHPLSSDDRLWAGEGRMGAMGSRLYSVDPYSGATTTLAELSAPITGLSFDGRGELWAVTAGGAGVGASVLTLDTETGAETHKFDTLQGGWSGFAWADLFVFEALLMWTEETDQLYMADTFGSLTGPMLGGSSYGHCLAIEAGGLGIRVVDDTLWEVDMFAGTTTLLGVPAGMLGSISGQGCTFHRGDLWTLGSTGLGGEKELVRVDVDAMVATRTGVFLPAGVDALASPTP
ncbi:MAG: hypothetical protein ACI8PZ_003279 [Myxococcota bacterium]|jgi:hypothetical protein